MADSVYPVIFGEPVTATAEEATRFEQATRLIPDDRGFLDYYVVYDPEPERPASETDFSCSIMNGSSLTCQYYGPGGYRHPVFRSTLGMMHVALREVEPPHDKALCRFRSLEDGFESLGPCPDLKMAHGDRTAAGPLSAEALGAFDVRAGDFDADGNIDFAYRAPDTGALMVLHGEHDLGADLAHSLEQGVSRFRHSVIWPIEDVVWRLERNPIRIESAPF